ncbi:anthranilate synthase component II [Microbacterium sp. ZW T5_56]|uniref:anthranilate synthase component II n=1 Tax=Microbacterium sp. ZW T5_56 TaxID=3378081 RepID=UPI0038542C2B
MPTPSRNSAPRILVVDNHDSFVHTLVGYLEELGARVDFVEADDLTSVVAGIRGYDGVMISPGPGRPEDAGASVEVVQAALSTDTPLLGVCLGHQAIAVALGGTVSSAPEPMHGRVSTVAHDGTGVFRGVRSDVAVGRYHSLTVDESSLPPQLRVTARAGDVVMGIAHRSAPIHGVQFHPESILTTDGYLMLANWLALTGDAAAVARAGSLTPHR